ncbi:Colicin V production protein [Planctomycetales bacterium 10988]|nr:Colicin V production protein [Planctomycetales bacterium 10988]
MNLHYYDIFMLVVLVAATMWGLWKGMAWQVASLSSLLLSYVVALRLSPMLAPYIAAESPWNRYLAMFIVYLGTSAAIWLIFHQVRKMIERVRLQEFDRQVGALIGLAKGLVLCLAITFFAVTLSDQARETILQTRSGYYAAVIMQKANSVLPEGFQDTLNSYFDRVEGIKELQGQLKPIESLESFNVPSTAGEFNPNQPPSIEGELPPAVPSDLEERLNDLLENSRQSLSEMEGSGFSAPSGQPPMSNNYPDENEEASPLERLLRR